MSNSDFNALVNAVREASFDQDRLGVITEAARMHSFSVDQVLALMPALSFEGTKIDIAAALYPNVFDQNNCFKIYKGFSFSRSRDALDKRIRRSEVLTEP